jgi:hypothetical protein
MHRIDILKTIDFGSGVAEDESTSLSNYFLPTATWESVLKGKVDLVYGAKGSGKSALYLSLLQTAPSLRRSGTHVIAAENPSGSPAFTALRDESVHTELSLRILWRIYFLALSVEEADTLKITGAGFDAAQEYLRVEKLLMRPVSKKDFITTALRWIKKQRIRAVKPGVEINNMGTPSGVNASIELGDNYESIEGSIDRLYKDVHSDLIRLGIRFWFAVDRLDAAFDQKGELENNALRALFTVYLDFVPLSQISIKIFLRDDIWDRMLNFGGFTEQSHLVRKATLRWDRDNLLHLVYTRLLAHSSTLSGYGFLNSSTSEPLVGQWKAFHTIFPKKMASGKSSESFNWLYKRLENGKGLVTPRDLIQACSFAKLEQSRRLELGHLDNSESLISTASLVEAWRQLSLNKLTAELYAEYPVLKKYIERFTLGKAKVSSAKIAEVFTDNPEALNTLTELGFFLKTARNSVDQYEIAQVYRPALSIKQGSETLLSSKRHRKANLGSKLASFGQIVDASLDILKNGPLQFHSLAPEFGDGVSRLQQYGEEFTINGSLLQVVGSPDSWRQFGDAVGGIKDVTFRPVPQRIASTFELHFIPSDGDSVSLSLPNLFILPEGEKGLLLSTEFDSNNPIEISLRLDFEAKNAQLRIRTKAVQAQLSALRSANRLVRAASSGGRIVLRNVDLGKDELTEVCPPIPLPLGFESFEKIIEQLFVIQKAFGKILTWPARELTDMELTEINRAYMIATTGKEEILVTNLELPTTPGMLGKVIADISARKPLELRMGYDTSLEVLGTSMDLGSSLILIPGAVFQNSDEVLPYLSGYEIDHELNLVLETGEEGKPANVLYEKFDRGGDTWLRT